METLIKALPTKKVTAFLVGAALWWLVLWVLVLAEVLEESPDMTVVAAGAIVVGFILAWFVPEGVWLKVQKHGGDQDG